VITDNNDGTYTYTPSADSNGLVTLNYSVSDGKGGITNATNTFTIEAENDDPIVANTPTVFQNINEDGELTIETATLLASFTDVDANTTLTIESMEVSQDAGTVVQDANGNYVFTPVDDFNGLATFSYVISDGAGGLLQQQQFIKVNPVNDAPTANDVTLSAASKEFITLKPGDFGFADAKDKDSLRSVILDFSSFGLDDLTMSDRELTLAEKTTKQVEVTYQQLANGYISVKAGAIASTKTIAFQVRDDGGTANDGIDTSLATNTLSVLATPPASNDKEILNMIRVGQALTQLEESLPPGERDPDVMKAANGLSSENRELFLEKFDSGLFDGAVDRARRFVYANIESQENLEAEKSDLEAQLAELQASADQSELDQSKIEALQSRLESLSSTLEQYTTLVPDVSLLDSLVQTDADGNPLPIDMDQLRSSLGDAAGDVISEANDEGNVDIKVGNSTSITMSQEELAELLASKQESFQDSLKQGFSDANEGTKAQIKTIAAAETFGATDSEAAANYDAAAKEFLAAGVTIADVLDTGDPTLTSKAKDLVSDGDAESLAKARATLETVESPFGGAATITAADLINEATRIKRTFADAILKEVDTLGTAELAHTNAAYIGALDGNVAGQPGVTFSADSKTMVFTFPLSPGQTQTTQILSYLAGGKDIYTYEQAVDDNGDPRFESDGTTPIMPSMTTATRSCPDSAKRLWKRMLATRKAVMTPT